MDALEQYLKIEKLDATQVTDSAIQHKQEKYNNMSQQHSEVENKGRTFIKEASEVTLLISHYYTVLLLNRHGFFSKKVSGSN